MSVSPANPVVGRCYVCRAPVRRDQATRRQDRTGFRRLMHRDLERGCIARFEIQNPPSLEGR